MDSGRVRSWGRVHFLQPGGGGILKEGYCLRVLRRKQISSGGI